MVVAHFGVKNFCNANAPQSFLATSTSQQMLAADDDRKGIVITNLSNASCYIAFGSSAAEVEKGIQLVKNEPVVLAANILPVESINVIASSGVGRTIIFQEFV